MSHACCSLFPSKRDATSDLCGFLMIRYEGLDLVEEVSERSRVWKKDGKWEVAGLRF